MCRHKIYLNFDKIYLNFYPILIKLAEKQIKRDKSAKVARQIFEFHKILHKIFNYQPILMIKVLKFT